MGHYSIDKKRCQEHKIEISETPVIIFPSRFVAPEAEQMIARHAFLKGRFSVWNGYSRASARAGMTPSSVHDGAIGGIEFR
jgi:hypothetical protein